MKSSIRTIFDFASMVMLVAAGLPIILMAISTFLNDDGGLGFGFGSYSDKSTVALQSQLDMLGISDELNEKSIWTNAHIFMMPVVDDESNTPRSVRVYSDAYSTYRTLSYPRTYQAQLHRGGLMTSYSAPFFGSVGESVFNTQRYHLYIDNSDGSLLLRRGNRVSNYG